MQPKRYATIDEVVSACPLDEPTRDVVRGRGDCWGVWQADKTTIGTILIQLPSWLGNHVGIPMTDEQATIAEHFERWMRWIKLSDPRAQQDAATT